MESNDHTARESDALGSRRARREAAAAQNRRTRSGQTDRVSSSHRLLGRTGILASLAIVTIAMPLTAGAGKADTGAQSIAISPSNDSALSTLEVLTTKRGAERTPVIVADADLLAERTLVGASRSGIRDEDASECAAGTVSGANGQLGASELCALEWAPGHRQQAEAAAALTALNDAYRVRFGKDICLTSSYRTISSQHQLAVTKPGLAATPGRSMHGWGLAIDFCPSSYGSAAQWNWLKANGPIFGYDNPAWARRGGSGAYEPWHWEYFPIVETM